MAQTGDEMSAALYYFSGTGNSLAMARDLAAPVLGGVSLFGGVGSLGGAMVGAFIIGVLSNGLNLLGIPSCYQQVIKGVVFILAVMLDLLAKRPR